MKIILYIRNLNNGISAAFKEPKIVKDVVDWEFLLLVARKQNIKEKWEECFSYVLTDGKTNVFIFHLPSIILLMSLFLGLK